MFISLLIFFFKSALIAILDPQLKMITRTDIWKELEAQVQFFSSMYVHYTSDVVISTLKIRAVGGSTSLNELITLLPMKTVVEPYGTLK